MKILWITLGMAGVFLSGVVLSAHFGNDPKVVTIVGNCAIPLLAALFVMFINHVKSQLALMAEDDEE